MELGKMVFFFPTLTSLRYGVQADTGQGNFRFELAIWLDETSLLEYPALIVLHNLLLPSLK